MVSPSKDRPLTAPQRTSFLFRTAPDERELLSSTGHPAASWNPSPWVQIGPILVSSSSSFRSAKARSHASLKPSSPAQAHRLLGAGSGWPTPPIRPSLLCCCRPPTPLAPWGLRVQPPPHSLTNTHLARTGGGFAHTGSSGAPHTQAPCAQCPTPSPLAPLALSGQPPQSEDPMSPGCPSRVGP